MASTRVHRIFAARLTTQGEDLFGEHQLVPGERPLDLAPIKRVALLSEAFIPKVDGVTKTSYLTVRYLQQTGREVLIFAPDTAVPNVGPSEVVPLPSFSMPFAEETRVAVPHPLIARRIEAFKPDLIHLASPAAMGVSGMAMGRHMNIPVVANYQTDLPGYAERYGYPLLSRPMRHWLRYIHNGCHLTLVPTEKIRAELHSAGFRRLRLWRRGVNLHAFSPSYRSPRMRARLLAGRSAQSLLCIYVGRLANEKCVEQLREVAAEPGIALTIIGDGARREELEQVFAGTGTVFTGYMIGEELSQAFASADVFFFTGPNETFGQVIQEAMASGLPVVVTDQGGAASLVEDGENGIICQHHPASFAAAARRLRDDRFFLARLAQNARRSVERFPWSAVMSQLEQFYRQALHINARFVSLFGTTDYHHLYSLAQRLPRGR